MSQHNWVMSQHSPVTLLTWKIVCLCLTCTAMFSRHNESCRNGAISQDSPLMSLRYKCVFVPHVHFYILPRKRMMSQYHWVVSQYSQIMSLISFMCVCVARHRPYSPAIMRHVSMHFSHVPRQLNHVTCTSVCQYLMPTLSRGNEQCHKVIEPCRDMTRSFVKWVKFTSTQLVWLAILRQCPRVDTHMLAKWVMSRLNESCDTMKSHIIESWHKRLNESLLLRLCLCSLLT